jgi:hypothetical protein
VIAPVTSAPVLAPAGVGATQVVTGGAGPSLLPDPGGASAQGLGDVMDLLYALNAKMEATESQSAQTEVRSTTKAQKGEMDAQRAARAKEEADRRKADEESHSFWHKVGKVAGVVAKVGTTVAGVAAAAVTCGAAVAVAVAAVSVTAAALKESGALGKAGGWVELGVDVAIGLFTIGAGTSVGAAMKITGGVGAAAGGVSTIATHVELANVAKDEADASDAGADAKTAEHQIAKQQRVIDAVIETRKEANGAHRRVMETVQQTLALQGQTAVAVSNFGRA